MDVKPFIKWVGGKSQLLTDINSGLPKNIDNITTYIEPFIGGGAVMFDIVPKMKNVEKVIINDLNSKLINVYRNIKDNHEQLITKLIELETEYLNYNKKGKEEMFYLIREKFNEHKKIYSDKDPVFYISNAVYFIFLNKTCFNGLFRVNKRGQFNVPFGKYANPTICNAKILRADSELLQSARVEIYQGDYNKTIDHIEGLTFVYLDPPYRPLDATSSFTSYAKGDFNDDDQRALAAFCQQLSDRGCLWMESNADCSAKNPEDTFFEDLYKNYRIERVYASRAINANPSKRGKLTELLIKNYE